MRFAAAVLREETDTLTASRATAEATSLWAGFPGWRGAGVRSEAATGAVSRRRLSPCCVPVGWWDCLQDLTFPWQQHESEYMAIQAARARSCSILQRLLASYLTALFCVKEIYTMHRHHVTPRCPARCNMPTQDLTRAACAARHCLCLENICDTKMPLCVIVVASPPNFAGLSTRLCPLRGASSRAVPVTDQAGPC